MRRSLMKSIGIASLICAVALTAGCNRERSAVARSDNTAARSDNGAAVGTSGETVAISKSDKDFVHDLTMAGNAEIQLGNLASSRAGKAEVKEFGQLMVKDHTAAGDQLKQ